MMATMNPGSWNVQHDHVVPASSSDDDFTQFLELGDMSGLGNMPFDFHDFAGQSNVAAGTMMDTPMGGTGSTSTMPVATTASTNLSAVPSPAMAPRQDTPNAISTIDAQIRFLQHQKLQEQHRQLQEHQRQFEEQRAAFFAQQTNFVPPTPHSLDLPANTAYYPAASSNAPHSTGMFDQFHQLKDKQLDMAFTPLASPAVTPLDTQFSIDNQYGLRGTYFSPLTSPALHAQKESVTNFERLPASTASLSSPAEIEAEMTLAHTTAPSSAAAASTITSASACTTVVPAPIVSASSVAIDSTLSKKVNKGNVTKSRKSTSRKSPLAKPQRRKTASTPVMSSQKLIDVVEQAAEEKEAQVATAATVATAAAGSSISNSPSPGNSDSISVSPEAMSDMPPPPIPRPRSGKSSPCFQPQTGRILQPGQAFRSIPSQTIVDTRSAVPSPATPASLFRISPNRTADTIVAGGDAMDLMETLELPEPEASSFSKPPSAIQSETQPSLSAEAATSSLASTLPPPTVSKPPPISSASQSPQIAPKSSTTSNTKKTPLIAAIGSKKRGSISSAHASPALLPKISPSIKPLLPGGASSSAEDTASLLLATKSNYQNMIEGNRVPGVSYSSDFSANLTSKRTSHKIAEQGRRNRINLALQEMAALLPKNLAKRIREDDGTDVGEKMADIKAAGNGPNSKASTIEMAIHYIKQLQQDLAETQERASEAEAKLAAAQSTAASE